MKDAYTRREALSIAGAGIATALAGCSGDDSPGTEQNQDTSQAGDGTSTTEGSGDQGDQTATDTGNAGDDTIFEGEEELEEYISSSSSQDSLTTLGQSEYQWVEFEEADSQLNLPSENLPETGVDAYIEQGQLPTGEFDTVYLALGQEGESYEIAWAFLLEDNWDSDSSVVENYESGFYSGGFVTGEGSEIEDFFSEDVNGYTDVSDDIPPEYLDLVEE